MQVIHVNDSYDQATVFDEKSIGNCIYADF